MLAQEYYDEEMVLRGPKLPDEVGVALIVGIVLIALYSWLNSSRKEKVKSIGDALFTLFVLLLIAGLGGGLLWFLMSIV